ncbi:MAG TPA: NAD(P)H-dependent oxidoreductase [Trueperaceae bacterium]|nr:NAD(P)H-dependent oxidoreductase [Trueperaceae bacterium]
MSQSVSDLPVLYVVVGSVRPGRVGLPIGRWFADQARRHGAFEVRLVDLAEVDLPIYDEPRHPRLGQYEHEHTKRWSALVDQADAFVFVTPEYNHSYGAALKNALDYLNREWRDKPAGVLSYGGVSAGTRALVALRPVLAVLGMPTVPTAVNVPFASRSLDEDGRFVPAEATVKGAQAMLDELARWTAAMMTLRRTAVAAD